MIGRLAMRDGAVYAALAAYFAINVLVRLAGPDSLELDEGQQLFFAQWLAPGYDSQPPFYNWLQYGVVQLLGSNMLAISLLKNLMLFLSYLFFGLTAHIIIRDRVLAVIATLGLITFPQVGYEAQRDLTHTVAVLFSACLFGYVFVRTLETPTAVNYALVGASVGFGVLSKYNFALLPLVAALAVLPDPQLRRRLFDPRMLIAIAVAFVIVLPHALWFLGHFDAATSRTLEKLTDGGDVSRAGQIASGVASLVGAFAAFVLPTALVFLIAFGMSLPRAWRAETQWTRLIGRMFAIALGLLLLVVILGASDIKDRWLVPIFLLLPIYLAAKLDASGQPLGSAPARFGAVVAAIMVVVPLALFMRPYLAGWTAHYGKQNVPYGQATAEILASGQHRPSVILTLDHQLAGNLRLHAPDIAVAVPGYAHGVPFAFDATHPVLAVWRRRDGGATLNPSEEMWRWLNQNDALAGRPLEAKDAAFPYHYGRDGDVYHFGYAWIYPAAQGG
ncbi:glycosyltransferase family 39 protein [Mesorhizobium sp. ZMM04-5]|uniref:Glycosyltransferase family 39 protein n=1 Tax=Mesorhizobium marinum TaxID=3228790 RepID=A0ABV3R075_9HYPH